MSCQLLTLRPHISVTGSPGLSASVIFLFVKAESPVALPSLELRHLCCAALLCKQTSPSGTTFCWQEAPLDIVKVSRKALN